MEICTKIKEGGKIADFFTKTKEKLAMDEKIITLKTGKLTVKISSRGAEAKSIKDDSGREYLWSGRLDVWKRQAPFLFPICGSLKEEKYTLRGREYSLKKHGFAMELDFAVESARTDEVIFKAEGTEKYKENYPFSYDLYVIYRLFENRMSVTYRVVNKGEETMYYSVGSHESYAYEGVLEDYAIVFEKPETLVNNLIEAPLLSGKTQLIGEGITHFPLKKEYFSKDSLVFRNLKSEKVSFVGKNGEKIVTVSFKGQNNLVFWTIPENGYFCIEPWSGLPDFKNASGKIEEKAEIIALEKGKTKDITHEITFGG